MQFLQSKLKVIYRIIRAGTLNQLIWVMPFHLDGVIQLTLFVILIMLLSVFLHIFPTPTLFLTQPSHDKGPLTHLEDFQPRKKTLCQSGLFYRKWSSSVNPLTYDLRFSVKEPTTEISQK